jgi:ABC-type antimicrobial peptide transport system, ATPase component
MSNRPVIELDDVSKIYSLASGDVIALDHLSLKIEEGEFVAIMGPSGSGKSTLLNQIGCLDVPTSGSVLIDGKNIGSMNDTELTRLRLSTIGYIFQHFNLIPLLNAYENVEYPYLMKHRKPDDSGRVTNLLEQVGIDSSLSSHKPSELSGGQQQRVAIARSLVNEPKILLCDEPTGNLDSVTGGQIMKMIDDLNRKGNTIIVVTHDVAVAGFAHRRINLQDGRIV